jgi:hypothetical protein
MQSVLRIDLPAYPRPQESSGKRPEKRIATCEEERPREDFRKEDYRTEFKGARIPCRQYV